MNDFLPVNREDMQKRGWDAPDFVYVSGDAYVVVLNALHMLYNIEIAR